MDNNNETPKMKWAMVIIAAAVIIVAGYFIYGKYKSASQLNAPATLGGQVGDQIQNPGSAVPDTNPYDAKTNPYEAKTNPFTDVYQNPFK